jgi:hypothetical protein
MIHDKDLSGHKTWRFIYGVIFIGNIFLSPSILGAGFTAIIGVIIGFLFWGQQKAIDDITKGRD